jgi:endo-1,4-beta-D-glucanase Y
MIVEKKKLFIIFGMIGAYLLFGVLFKVLLAQGIIEHAPPAERDTTMNDTPQEVRLTPTLEVAQSFFEKNLQKEGHIDLYYVINATQSFDYQNYTNSEAVSYYLLWTANAGQKEAFDMELDFIEKNMLHKKGYLMWRLSPDDKPINDGTNIATDADLRAIHALLIAEKQWGDERYTQLINTLAGGIEHIAITRDGMLAPYGGYSGETPWRTNEVWLSYNDFITVDALAKRRGEPWKTLYVQMKNVTLRAQIANGLYNSMLTDRRQYGNGIDDGGYGINSLWMMVRNAESEDPELMASARKSLEFYKKRFVAEDSTIYTSYSSSGDPLTSYDSPWVYALVGRAAVALGDEEASRDFINKLSTFQVTDEQSPLYGSFPEGIGEVPRVGQFTMQESILTLQDYIRKYGEVKP